MCSCTQCLSYKERLKSMYYQFSLGELGSNKRMCFLYLLSIAWQNSDLFVWSPLCTSACFSLSLSCILPPSFVLSLSLSLFSFTHFAPLAFPLSSFTITLNLFSLFFISLPRPLSVSVGIFYSLSFLSPLFLIPFPLLFNSFPSSLYYFLSFCHPFSCGGGVVTLHVPRITAIPFFYLHHQHLFMAQRTHLDIL